jgi:hypothetical protein
MNEIRKYQDYEINFSNLNKQLNNKNLYHFNLTKPKEHLLGSQVLISQNAFIMPLKFSFKAGSLFSDLEVSYLDSTNTITNEPVNNLYLSIIDDELKVSYKDRNDEFTDLLKTNTLGIENECILKKDIFRMCAILPQEYPIIETNDAGEELVYENPKIKFAIQLKDKTSPDSVFNLEAKIPSTATKPKANSDGTVSFVKVLADKVMVLWEQKEISDLVLFKIYVRDDETGYETLIDNYFIDERVSHPEVTKTGNTEIGILYNKTLSNGNTEYYLEVDTYPERIPPFINTSDEGRYFFRVESIDTFENNDNSMNEVLLS